MDNNIYDDNLDQNLNDFIFKDFDLKNLNELSILKYCRDQINTHSTNFYNITADHIELNFGIFQSINSADNFPIVQVSQKSNSVKISCFCAGDKSYLCIHQAQVLFNILKRKEFRIFFDSVFRNQELKTISRDYGLELQNNLDNHFEVVYSNNKVSISPKNKSLFPFNSHSKAEYQAYFNVLDHQKLNINIKKINPLNSIIVFSKHKYYNQLVVELYEVNISKTGKIKNPIQSIDIKQILWNSECVEEIKLLNSILFFQHNYESNSTEYLNALTIIQNQKLDLKCFLHDAQTSQNIAVNSITEFKFQNLVPDLRISIHRKEEYYEITSKIIIDDHAYDINHLKIVYDYLIKINDQIYLIDQDYLCRVIHFFNKQNNRLVLHKSKYDDFKESILSQLENKIKIDYSYLQKASQDQIEEHGFDLENEKLIYLSESEDFVLITPVLKYGDLEIPILSKKQIKAKDKLGNDFILNRNDEEELQFVADILKQHTFFYEQRTVDCYYLHKKRFLEQEWFLNAFEAWRSKGIQILGFNKLKDNKLNEHKVKIDIKVLSGTDWFETKVKVNFGSQNVSLKHLHKSIRNKSKFVALDDGTLGILPEEWIKKFENYFNHGTIIDDVIRTDKINFNVVDNLYEDYLLDKSVIHELKNFRKQFDTINKITEVIIPSTLKTKLRPYQQDGVNWLNFLDNFNFGACLADDMGLGKTIQIIAFILSQREKVENNLNLIIVPASLISNWQAEIKKFAPSIKLYTYYGSDRNKLNKHISDYEVILTSYGTLLSDIKYLKNIRFNYTILDESQNIKNPESQRYKACMLLNTRNRIALTGTPIENNTFDLYGQLSFTCPGLLGSKNYFSSVYAIPIDQFKDKKRTQELQLKISPFILRRTKEEVAKELPEKTEIVIYCEMGKEQRDVYEANKREIQDFILGKTDDELSKSSMHVLRSITRLRQICNSAAILSDGKSFIKSSSKIDVLLENIENKIGNHKILIFSQFVKMLDLLAKELDQRKIDYQYLTGQTRNRAKVIEDFKNNSESRIFLMSLKAGGVGLNLTEADYVFLIDPWWNPAVENQAIDRVYRIGQQKNVFAIRLICPNTIEEKIMKLQSNKKKLVKNVLSEDKDVVKLLTKDGLLSLLS